MQSIQRVRVLGDAVDLSKIVGDQVASMPCVQSQQCADAFTVFEAWITLLAGCTFEFDELVQAIRGAMDWSDIPELSMLNAESLAARISSPLS